MSSTLVTGNFFQVLCVRAALGRTLTPGDDEPSAGRPVVLRAPPLLAAGEAQAEVCESTS